MIGEVFRVLVGALFGTLVHDRTEAPFGGELFPPNWLVYLAKGLVGFEVFRFGTVPGGWLGGIEILKNLNQLYDFDLARNVLTYLIN